MANHKRSSERYNDRMSKLYENARRIERERLERGEMPNPSLTSPDDARKYGWEIVGRKVTRITKFSPGRIGITPGALEVLERSHTEPSELLRRHLAGDWGEVCPEDKRENELSLEKGFRIVSNYPLSDGFDWFKVWIITEADRSSTTILLPEEY